MMTTNKKRVVAYLTDKEKEALAKYAKLQGRSMSAQLIYSIRKDLQKAKLLDD